MVSQRGVHRLRLATRARCAQSRRHRCAVGIEPDAAARAEAEARLAGTAATVEQREFGPEPSHTYDLIVFVASLHHMPLSVALDHARRSLREGGRIVIVGLACETRRDAFRTGISVLLNPLIGLVKHPSRARPSAPTQAPIAEPTQTFEEIRAVAEQILPGVRMRRRLFWRYTAHWQATGEITSRVR